MAHFLGRYKQPWHITYEGTNGENWKQENGQWHYYVPEDHMNYTYDQYVDYWNRNEPNSVLHYGNKQYVVKKKIKPKLVFASLGFLCYEVIVLVVGS